MDKKCTFDLKKAIQLLIQIYKLSSVNLKKKFIIKGNEKCEF